MLLLLLSGKPKPLLDPWASPKRCCPSTTKTHSTPTTKPTPTKCWGLLLLLLLGLAKRRNTLAKSRGRGTPSKPALLCGKSRESWGRGSLLLLLL